MKGSSIIAFLIGAAVGGVSAWLITKKKCKKAYQEELDEVRQYYSSKDGVMDTIEKACKGDSYAPRNDDELAAQVYRDRYGAGKAVEEAIAKAEEDPDTPEGFYDGDEPDYIGEEEFGCAPDFSTLTYRYYANRILCDDGNEPIKREDWAKYIVPDFYEHFNEEGHYGDTIYIRNYELKADIEILRCPEPYIE